MSNTKSILIYADIVGSEKLLSEHAERWKNVLHPALQRLNADYQSHLLMPFETVAGDSFGSVINDLPTAAHIVLSIQESLQPVEARIVLIKDTIRHGLDGQHFNELHGEALWKASEAVEQLKKSKTLFTAQMDNEALTLSLNTIVNLILAIRQKWSPTTWAIYQHYQQGETQKTIAESIGVSQQYISKSLNEQHIRLIIRCQRDMMALCNLLEKQNGMA